MLVAQLDRALVSEARGRGFDSPQAHHSNDKHNMEQKMAISFKCLKNIGFCLTFLWILVVVSFFVSFSFSFILEGWGQVGWIVPLFCCIGLIFFFVLSASFLFLICVKESLYKQTNITIGLLEKTNCFLSKKWLTNLSVITFWLTMLLSILAVWTWILFIISCTICFAYDFIKNKFGT